jgi:quercetin dioxygenase-like cupin family protein
MAAQRHRAPDNNRSGWDAEAPTRPLAHEPLDQEHVSPGPCWQARRPAGARGVGTIRASYIPGAMPPASSQRLAQAASLAVARGADFSGTFGNAVASLPSIAMPLAKKGIAEEGRNDMADITTATAAMNRDGSGRRAVKWLVGAGAALALPLSAAAAADQEALPSGFETRPVLKTGETRDGDPIVYPDGGNPEIISVVGTIEPGGRTPLHQHPVPVYVYILEGEVELETEGGEPHRYVAGEVYIEALDREHQLFNRSDAPASVLVVFIGEEGQPTTITATQ